MANTEMYPGASAFADKLLDASDSGPQPSTCKKYQNCKKCKYKIYKSFLVVFLVHGNNN